MPCKNQHHQSVMASSFSYTSAPLSLHPLLLAIRDQIGQYSRRSVSKFSRRPGAPTTKARQLAPTPTIRNVTF
jgi:hypothetical protein